MWKLILIFGNLLGLSGVLALARSSEAVQPPTFVQIHEVFTLGDIPHAFQLLDKRLQTKPLPGLRERQELYKLHGICAFLLGRDDDGIKSFESALKIDINGKLNPADIVQPKIVREFEKLRSHMKKKLSKKPIASQASQTVALDKPAPKVSSKAVKKATEPEENMDFLYADPPPSKKKAPVTQLRPAGKKPNKPALSADPPAVSPPRRKAHKRPDSKWFAFLPFGIEQFRQHDYWMASGFLAAQVGGLGYGIYSYEQASAYSTQLQTTEAVYNNPSYNQSAQAYLTGLNNQALLGWSLAAAGYVVSVIYGIWQWSVLPKSPGGFGLHQSPPSDFEPSVFVSFGPSSGGGWTLCFFSHALADF